MRCPCRKKSETIRYSACCEPRHTSEAPARSAEALMRSRYSAFVLQLAPYLLATWHASTRPSEIAFESGREWMLLKVIAAEEAGDSATVEFRAQSRLAGRTHVLHEVSRFVREDGRWYYVDGVVSP
ncbi:MAG: hypothetical protein EKK41_21355 [Hyphomicrobiales bacterium]|nr:MAG: hypothetical protein EKK41_21355 [Hyphomicrobiales bacterium]